MEFENHVKNRAVEYENFVINTIVEYKNVVIKYSSGIWKLR